MINTIGPGPCNAYAHYFGPPETAAWTSCHCGDRESTHIGDKWHVRPAMRAAAALLVASREPGQAGLHARAELESLRKYSAIPDVRVAVAPPRVHDTDTVDNGCRCGVCCSEKHRRTHVGRVTPKIHVNLPPPMTAERADEMIAEFERTHAAGAFAAPVPAGYRFENFDSRPAAGSTSTTFAATPIEAKASIEMAAPAKPRECPLCHADLAPLTSWQHSIVWPGFATTLVTCTKDACMAWAQRCHEQAKAASARPREPGIGARVRWDNSSTASWIEGVLLDREPPAECWLAAIRVERCSSGFIRDSIVTVGVDCGRTLLIGADASSYPVAKAPMPEQLPAIRARLDEIRREPHQRIMLDTDPPARPDGFAQSQVDAAKAVLLASVPRKAGK